ncbi:hypothetical protein [Natrinema longum]|uniref:Uncharacterized protein n=1 Tax=Natrinema longum TaxID=370324 RepID=A0A8A2UDQ0_9EURY|nr:hypothetical protein [Natrinema longum]MBZ6495158.1 hypothetical protein [Natrinema longum]QSW86859.1 hypothetical protein J0X27_08625 [Natrinema longum]
MYEKPIGHPGENPFEALVDVLTAVTRYDLLLGIIPLAFAVALVTATMLGLSVVQTLLIAGVVGAFAVVDACYLNPPVDQGSA